MNAAYASLEEYYIERKPDSGLKTKDFRDFYQKFRLHYARYFHPDFRPDLFFLKGMDGRPVMNPSPNLVFRDSSVFYDPVFHQEVYKVMKGLTESLTGLPANLFVHYISEKSLAAAVLHFALYARRHSWILDIAYACAGYESDHPYFYISAALILLFSNDTTRRAEYFYKKSGIESGRIADIYRSMKNAAAFPDSRMTYDPWDLFFRMMVSGNLSWSLRHLIKHADVYKNYKAVNAVLFHIYFINGKVYPYLKKTAEILSLPYSAHWYESQVLIGEFMKEGGRELHRSLNENKQPESLPDDTSRRKWEEQSEAWIRSLSEGGSSEFPFYLYRGHHYRKNFDYFLNNPGKLDIEELRSLAGESLAARALLAVYYTESGDFEKSRIYLRGLPLVHPAVIQCRERNILPHISKKFSKGTGP